MVLWQSGKTRAALKLQMQSKQGRMRRRKMRRRQMNSVREEGCVEELSAALVEVT